MSIIPVQCKSACHKIKSDRFPYKWDLNIYKGCSVGCRYCYAIYTQPDRDNIEVKTNIVEELDRQLSSPKWRGDIINIGGVTDSYQEVESQYKLMPEVLKILIKHKNPCIISTKSDLIQRDFDLIAELSRLNYVNIACSITTMDEKLRKKLQPGGSSGKRLFQVLKEFKKTEVSTGTHLMPIVPYITDQPWNLERIYALTAENRIDYLLPGIMYLKGSSRDRFLTYVKENHNEIYYKMMHQYSGNSDMANYKTRLYGTLGRLKEKYSISYNYSQTIKEKFKQEPLQPNLDLYL